MRKAGSNPVTGSGFQGFRTNAYDLSGSSVMKSREGRREIFVPISRFEPHAQLYCFGRRRPDLQELDRCRSWRQSEGPHKGPRKRRNLWKANK